MKKTLSKAKGNGCKKISSYFKTTGTVLKKTTSSQNDNDIIVLDSDEEQINLDHKEIMSKRKLENGESNISPPFKKHYCKTSPVPSTSETNSVINIKNIKELLSPRALKEYNTMNEKVEKVLDEIKQNTHISEIIQCKTPEKQNLIKKKTPIKSSEKASVSNKKTPKKLYLQSPNKINVDVLKNFVKVTPKMSNNAQYDEKKCGEVQNVNETTPKKYQIVTSFSPTEKVRTQLDFSSCNEVVNQEVASELGVVSNENINLSDLIFDDSWGDDMFEGKKYTLDLSVSQHCEVISTEKKKLEVILTVKSTNTDEQAICRLRDIWFDTKLNIGDTLNITAIKSGEDNEWLVDNHNGILVYEPDFLISATSIANGVFCKRKVVFTEKYRGFDPTNKHMIVGSMVHMLLQDVLIKKIYQLENIKNYASELVKKPNYVADIYACGEPYDTVKEEFFVYVPKVYDFITNYIQKNTKLQASKKDDWKGRITDIEDIEENIWCTSLGVKGKVDITIKNGDEVLPIEVKSGRATVSVEHRGQVLLYIMMMNKLGYKVSSGLLLYLKEGILKEVPPTASEKAGLMMLRNELAFYLTKQPKLVNDDSAKSIIEQPQLPDPIYNRFCGSCPYNVICVTQARYFNQDISHLKPLRKVSDEIGDAITPEHVDYFMKWSALLTVEMGGASGRKNLKEIFTVARSERKKKGKCLIDLRIKAVTKEDNRLYTHKFEESKTKKSADVNFLASGLADHNYVVVSTEDRPAIASGFITQMSPNSVEVTLERDLTVKFKDKLFFIDSYDSTSLLTSSMASLGLILDTSEQGNKLRRIIVDRHPPTFQKTIPKTVALKAKPILKRLNMVQRRAVLRAIATEDYFLIKGMPGTGKTATIVALVELLVATGKTVLITSHTHSAVDNVCLRLVKYGVDFMRLGNKNRINKDLWPFCEDELTRNCSLPEELETVYNNKSVVAVTCLGSSHFLLSRRKFDVCIVDESTQVVQCSVFRPIFSAKTFILIGDPDQLPAVIQNNDAVKLGMDESLFERLDSEVSRISLNINYRMNEPITALANALTYKDELVIGSEEIAKATLHIPKIEVLKSNNVFSWMLPFLSSDLDLAVQFIDTGPTWNLSHKVHWCRTPNVDESEKYTNIYEAAVIFHLVEALLKGGVTTNQIGVIATYRSQVAQLATLLKDKSVEVNTVDQYQGKDKNVIIYSCSKSIDCGSDWSTNQFELLESKRRLNVAITRAKHKLIIIGDWNTLKHYSTFKAIENNLKKNFTKLQECTGFSWSDILDLVRL
ncbi:DNA replication helicase/nuclease 2 isoform X1 [Rhynchophorus ferrugineus]|uniref:DNA replication helicase/nuclease 2 isoform X1 n=2 Tax=Rhynchophorus ferrugineus TaxID=354439 RepID=UPI003FCD2960